MRVLLVDDHPLFREGLASVLQSQPDFDVVGEAGSVCEAVEMARALQPDVVVMDFCLPDGSGADASRVILSERPRTKIVFLTVHDDDDCLFAAISGGAHGYLLKNAGAKELVASLRALKHGEAAISRTMTGRLLSLLSRLGLPQERQRIEPSSELTAREVEILREMATGASNREIAECLVVSESTVKNHVHNILAKLGLRNRREAARYARRHGLTKPTLSQDTR